LDGASHYLRETWVSKKYLRTNRFKSNFMPGICPYKLLYVWLDLILEDGEPEKNFGWLYWLPNPLFPFIWSRVAGGWVAPIASRRTIRS